MSRERRTNTDERFEWRATGWVAVLATWAVVAAAAAPLPAQEAGGDLALVAASPATTAPSPAPGAAADSASGVEGTLARWSRFVGSAGAAGITLGLATDVDGSRLLGAGIERRGAVRSLQRLSVTVELGALLGIPGGTVFAEGHSWMGRNGSDAAGDVHGYSNIDAEPFRHLAELWYEQTLAGELLRLKAGYVDANTELAYVENGGGFINSAMGFSPTIVVLPTYPERTAGLVAVAEPGRGARLALAAYDGSATAIDGLVGGRELLLLGEAGRSWTGSRPGRVGLGAWRDGWWLVADQTLWRAGEEGTRVAAFLQLGTADGRVSEVRRHVGAGLVWTGAVPGRPDEAIGLALSRIEMGSDGHGETAVELYYELHLPFGVVLRPDAQYLRDPGATGAGAGLLVTTLRVSFER